ncbi:MAG: mRNA-decapping enzyme subunit 2 [Icmadophila ericetorum]|nr:mRNA-decapping enzyme subunit 2 [Icmadophila ericetorum]
MTETKMQLVDWLDDLCVRFIVNLPKEELESVERICFQVEEAQWFYEDFIRPLDPSLPSLNLKQFCLRIFQHCPLFSGFSNDHYAAAFSEFLLYKTRVPVRGAIMLNEAMDEVVLVKGWKKGANWSFPRGKINKAEKDLDCAIREVYEETGFDIKGAGLVESEQDAKFIEVNMREQQLRLYVFRDVPMDTPFEPRTRKEISKIQWYKLSELPTLKKSKHQHQQSQGDDLANNANKFYMVAPFLVPLKKWISQQRRQDALKGQIAMSDAPNMDSDVAQMEGSHIHNGVNQVPPADNLGRLIAGLQKSKHPQSMECLPTMSDPIQMAREASNNLKNLLHVAERQQNGHTMAADLKDHGETSNLQAQSLMNLLGAKGNSRQGEATNYGLVPQTPFDKVIEPPNMAPSPQHPHPVRQPQIRDLSPPPSFPYSPNQVGKKPMQQPVVSPMYYPQSQPRSSYQSLAQHPGMNPNFGSQEPSIPSPSSMSSGFNHSNFSAPAPYRRTGDPQFVQTPQFSHRQQQPSIPPASDLPTPSLNSHSSALLNIFKSANPFNSSSVAQTTTSQHPTQDFSKSIANPQLPSILQQALNKHPVTSAPQNLIAQPVSNMQSPQQQQLLNLFRQPSIPAASIGPAASSLGLPLIVAELSATPSPSHSRVASKVDRSAAKSAQSQHLNGKVTIKKRPERPRTVTEGNVSATVTGPLNVPQFDKIARRPVSPKSPKGAIKKEMSLEQRQAPVTILARPVGEQKDTPAASLKVLQSPKLPKAIPQLTSVKVHASSVKSKTPRVQEDKKPAKPFQPQILKRAQPQPQPVRQAIPQVAPAPASTPLKIATKELLDLDKILGQSEQKPKSAAQTIKAPLSQSSPLKVLTNNILASEHKSTLLSLFNKPSTSATPITSVFPSPLSDRTLPPSGRVDSFPIALLSRSSSFAPPARADTSPQPAITPLNARSRIGSINSVKMSSGLQTPAGGMSASVASPVDKAMLLNYLDGVVREGGQ